MKGQYFLPMILLALFLVTMVFVYYSSTSQITIYQVYSYQPTLADNLAKITSDIKQAYVESIYLGDPNHLTNVITQLEAQASSRGDVLVVSCSNGSEGNFFWLYCSLNLSNGENQALTDFNFTYTVPFKIKTYVDPYFAQETDYFYKGETVYLWISGNNSDHLLVNVYDPYGRIYTNWTGQFENWHWNASFKPSISGNWTIVAEDTNTSKTTSKKIHINVIQITLKTFNSNGTAQTDFYPGETVNVSVWLEDLLGNKPNCSVKIDFTNAIGKQTYSLEGTAKSGFYTGLVKLSPWEIPGNMTITATEHCYWSQDQLNITILSTYWDRFIKIEPPRMYYNRPHTQVFGTTCGYSEWYTSNETNYSIVPFYVENTSTDTALLVNQTTLVIDVPNANISWIHLLGSKRVIS